MRKKIGRVFLFLIYALALSVALKWGFYDSIIEPKLDIIDFVLLPFIILIKCLVCFFGLVFMLAINSFCFTNVFKE